MHAFRALYFWVMAVSVTVLFYLICLATHLRVVLLSLPRDGRAEHRVAALWGRQLIRLMPGWSVDVKGREHLPKTTMPMVIVANHESFADIWAMYYLGIQFRWLSKRSVFKVPLVGRAMRWANYVPVERGAKNSTHSAMATSALRLREGLPMFFFPEGTRSVDGKLKPFKLGAFKLAKDEQVPVLPIAIHGANGLLPKHAWVPGRARVSVHVLPLVPPPSPGEDLDAYAAKVRSMIVQVHSKMV